MAGGVCYFYRVEGGGFGVGGAVATNVPGATSGGAMCSLVDGLVPMGFLIGCGVDDERAPMGTLGGAGLDNFLILGTGVGAIGVIVRGGVVVPCFGMIVGSPGVVMIVCEVGGSEGLRGTTLGFGNNSFGGVVRWSFYRRLWRWHHRGYVLRCHYCRFCHSWEESWEPCGPEGRPGTRRGIQRRWVRSLVTCFKLSILAGI